MGLTLKILKMESRNKTNRISDALFKPLGKVAAGLMLFLTTANLANAQDDSAVKEGFLSNLNETEIVLLIAMGVLIALTLLIVVVFIYVLSVFRLLQADQQKSVAGAAHEKEKESFWKRFNKRFISGDLLPVEQEKEIMMDHEYDGIYELNNSMPPWLKYLFYATIAIAFFYVMHYLVLDTGKLQIEEYEEELALAEEEAASRTLLAGSSIDENNVVFVTDEAVLGEAEALYLQNCAACHGADGGGTVGPNLTDEYWLHGGSIQDVFKVIKYGVQEKGMIPWQGKLSPEEMQNMASYVLSLQGTTPASPKEPQGEKFEMETAAIVGSLEE